MIQENELRFPIPRDNSIDLKGVDNYLLSPIHMGLFMLNY